MTPQDLHKQISESPENIALRDRIRNIRLEQNKLREQLEETLKEDDKLFEPLLKACIEKAETVRYLICPETHECGQCMDSYGTDIIECPCFTVCPSRKKR